VAEHGSDPALHRATGLPAPLLLFLSGFSILALEFLWMRQLGTVVGAAPRAAAATLAAFLVGLAAGNRLIGSLAARTTRPWRTVALVLAGGGIAGALFTVVLQRWGMSTMALLSSGNAAGTARFAELALAIGSMLPPAFLLGGDLPALMRALVRPQSEFGRTAPALYAWHVAGAVGGTMLAGFYLPLAFGLRASVLLVCGCRLLCAAGAWMLDRSLPPTDEVRSAAGAQTHRPAFTITVLACASGTAAFAMQMLWGRMFLLVTDNSVYSFAAVISVAIACLPIGAALATFLVRRGGDPLLWLRRAFLGGALLVAITPLAFHLLTGGLTPLSAGSWAGYLTTVVGVAIATVAPTALVLALVFPLLLAASPPHRGGAAVVTGRLLAVNAIGGIVGILAANLLLPGTLGLWRSMSAVALLCLLASEQAARSAPRDSQFRKTTAVRTAALALVLLALMWCRLPTIRVSPGETAETIRESLEGPAGSVTVVESGEDLRLHVNNSYAVGSSQARGTSAWFGHLPMYLHPRPRSVFVLGMGTGITAGAPLSHRVERVVACDIIPEVIALAHRHFAPFANGLFEDVRATVLNADGRLLLRTSNASYDVIIADLFVPWKAGIGGLYTREHYRVAAERLNENGLFVQWLPLYQATDYEFAVIARTMLDVFPLVTLWRGSFDPRLTAVAVIGHRTPEPLRLDGLEARMRSTMLSGSELDGEVRRFVLTADGLTRSEAAPALGDTLLLYYAGNLTACSKFFRNYPVNTDDHPVIEYRAPRAGPGTGSEKTAFVGSRLGEFFCRAFAARHPEADTYLTEVGPSAVRMARMGLALYQLNAYTAEGDERGARLARTEMARLGGRQPDTGAPWLVRPRRGVEESVDDSVRR